METQYPAWTQDSMEDARLDGTRSHILYSQSRLTFLYPVVSASALCGLLWDVSAHAVLLTWLTLVAGLTLLRYRVLWLYQCNPGVFGPPGQWLNVFALSAFLSGLLWGAAPVLIVPHQADRLVEFTLYNGLVMLVVCGLVAGATVAYAVSLRVLFCFTVPALLPPGLFLIALGDRYNGALGGLVLLYFVFISVAALRMHLQLQRFFELEYQLERLRQDLKSAPGLFTDTAGPAPAARAPQAD